MRVPVPRTPEQEEADHRLAEAISHAAKVYGQTDEYVLGAWFVVAQAENLEDVEDERYAVFTPSLQFPRFHSVGLLHTALSMIDSGWSNADH